MHYYALHSPVRAECLCCKLEQAFVFKSNSDIVVCAGCSRHQGDGLQKAKLRDADHIAMWSSGFQLALEEHAEEVGQLQQRIEALNEVLRKERQLVSDLRFTLKSELNQRAESVQKWIDDERVAEALAQRDSAYRSRDRAMAHLWTLDQLHHDRDRSGERCSCGKSVRACQEWQALDPIAGTLYQWERKQEERRDMGLPHALPDGTNDFLWGLRRAR
ncbi:hypothetical protein [Nocardia sp. R7R-8]|uniref:hypothetical protein n=1 Tax=Nocardia sp. R7R-8 TaxID=3459304 RepID=UPI00403DF4EB